MVIWHKINLVPTDLVSSMEPDVVVTGCCVGIDAFVYHWFYRNYPDIKRVVCLPGSKSRVDMSVQSTADVIYDDRAIYHARNEQIVEESDVVVAFWTGKKAYSGTWMTMNFANRAGKLDHNLIFGMGIGNGTMVSVDATIFLS